MYRMSPAQFARLSPRQQVTAALAGLGNTHMAVEQRNQYGALTSVVPATAPAKAMVSSILTAPVISSPFANGRYQVVESRPQFGWKTGSVLNPPGWSRRSPESTDFAQKVCQVAGLQNLAGLGVIDTSSVAPNLMPTPTRFTTSRAVAPPVEDRPAYTGEETPVETQPESPVEAEAQPEPPVPTTTSNDAATEGQTRELPAQPAVPVGAGAAATTAPGLPMWQLGLGAAALFGGIWYLTRK